MRPVRSVGSRARDTLVALVAIAVPLMSGELVYADGEVTSVTVGTETATPLQYSAGGTTYTWGVTGNAVLESFEYQGKSFTDLSRAELVKLRRVDLPQATGEPCGVFAENTGNWNELVPNYPARVGGTDNCDMAAMLGGRVINRGALNVFSNVGPDPKNVERVDYLFPNGLIAPLNAEAMKYAGHIVAEKRGNNPIQIAAITSLDGNGDPSAFGSLIRINAAGCAAGQLCYGVTQIEHNYSFLQNASTGEQGFVTYRGGARERVAMALVTTDKLGLSPGQRYFGFAFFAPDVNPAQHDLTKPETFPRDTADNFILPGDSADFYGGVSGWYVDDNLGDSGAGSVLSGAVYVDTNANGILDPNEAALDGVTVSLVADSNGNGVYDPGTDSVVSSTESSQDGGFHFVGVSAGLHFLVLDGDDADIPPGLQLLPGSNPIAVDVTGEDQSGLDFAFGRPLGDGTLPVAVADSVSSPQDQAITVDVLANDQDPFGAGLTLVSVGGAQNGTVTIVGNEIQYTPDFGFIGNDSFVYVMEDGAGQQATGTVSVTMLQFSDINNNGIDDYIECGCTDIRLLTGLDGIGVGGFGFGLFAFALIGLRSRRLRLERSSS